MDDTLINNKLVDLQQYIPFLSQVINNLKNNNNDKPRPQQLQKMEMLFSLITNKDKKPLKLETLVKCETVVQKIYNKIEKQRDDSSNSSPATVESISTPSKTTTENPEIIEITEPDSPPIVDQSSHAPPIVIPTERKESPSPTASTSKQHQNINKGRKMNKWQNHNPEFKRCDDKLTDYYLHRPIPTIDRTRNESNDRLNINFDRIYTATGEHHHENEIYDNRRNYNGGRNSERNSRLEIINKDCFDIPSIRHSYPNERHFETNERNRFNLMNSVGDFQQHDKFPENHSSFTDHLRNANHDNYHRGNIRHYPEEPGFSEWLQNNQKPNNHERYNREIIDIQKNAFDYKHDNRNIRDSPPRSHSRNHNRRDVPDRTDRIDRMENIISPNWDIDDNSPDRSHLGPLTSFDQTPIGGLSSDWGIVEDHSPDRSHLGPLTSFDRTRSNKIKNKNKHNTNLIEIPISSQENSIKPRKSNEQFNDSSKITYSKIFENFPNALEEPDNSIFNRLGNKIDMTENFQIKVKNERAIPISKAPLIKDVLKSPPLSAHDIDELYHESGGEVNNNFDVVRKKLAKISSKLKDDNLNRNQINSKSSSTIKSPDPNRLAYKYNPHPRVSLDDPLSPKSSENTLPKSAENNILKSPIDPRIQKQQKNSTNTLPSVKPNDPRLKIWCTDIVTQIPASSSSNSIQNPLPSSSGIPSLLDLNIPPLLDLPKPINDILQIKAPIKQIDDVTDKNLNSSLRSSPETSSDSLNYKKFHPLLNDQVERTKYLESKKNKPNTETITKKATTYGEHRRKAEEDNRKDSLPKATTKINTDKSKLRDRDIKNNDMDKKSSKDCIDIKNRDIGKPSNRVESDIKKSGKSLDLIKKQFESTSRDPKHNDKTKDNIKRRSDNIGNIGTNSNNRSDGGNKALPNCLDSMYRTSNYKKDLGSVASFKIPKKGKEEDKNKIKEQNSSSNEQQEIIVAKSNVYDPSKTKEKSKLLAKENTSEKIVKNDLSIIQQSTKVTLEPSLNSTETNNVSESSKKTDNIQELNDNKIQPINRRQTDEKIKINLIKKNSEILSPSSIELDSDDNWVILSEIGTENTYEDTTENEENNSLLSDKESTENTNSKHLNIINEFNTNESVEIEKSESLEVENELEKIPDQNVEEIGTVIPKPLRARRKSVYDIVVSTSDNSVVSTQNIISGKRRNRSSNNLNENLLAISKVQIAAAESAISDQRRSATPTNNFSNAKTKERKLLRTKNYFKNKRLRQKIEKVSSELPSSPELTQNLSFELSSPQPSTSNSFSYNTVATGENCIKKEELSKDSLESFLLDMMNPTKNKSNFLGMLAKVLDDNKFQQVKKIIEDDDTDTKNEFDEKKNTELQKNKINKSELSNKVTESFDSQAIVKQECFVEKRKQKKKLTELERLNEDIRDMFISKGVITATGRRMCTMMNAVREERDVSLERSLSRQQQLIQTPPTQSKMPSKQSSPTKKKNNPSNSAETIKFSNLNKVPKIVLSKVDISKVNGSKVSAAKKRNYSKRRKRYAWSKGIISTKKIKKIPGTKKPEKVDNTTTDNIVAPSPSRFTRSLNSSINKMPVLKPITPTKSTGGTRIIRKDKPCPKSKKKFDFSNDEELIQIGDEPILDNSIYIDPSMPILTTISYQKELAELPQSEDLLNVTKLKNIYSGMHAKSEYTNKCVLCKFTGTKVANHYSVNHPDSEVFISRLPPDTLKDLLANKNNHALYSFRKKQQHVYHYRCPFCDIQQSFSRKSWIDHFSTHTGEYMYKCSNCKRCVNNKQAFGPHFENVCPNGEIIVRQQLSKDIKVVEAFVCNLCNYVQMVEENVIKHLKEQHNVLNGYGNKFNSIILINIHNIPLLGNEEQQQQAALADTIPKTNMDFIDPNQTTDTDKLDPFVGKEQNDLSLDKNFMNYMNDMSSFSTAESSSQILGKSSSIIDQLSERLQSGNNGDVISSGTKPKTPINRRYSIAEQLSNRFKNVSQQHDNIKVIRQHTIENTTNNDDGAESPIPVVYILDNLDDDIDNVELAESSEQLIVPVDKPISTARANQLNEMMSDTNRNNDNSDKNSSTNSSSIIARLNERFKSPQKIQINKAKEVLQEKASVSRPGTMIIDRLNRRLNSIDDREKPDNLQKTQNRESFMKNRKLLSDELPSISSKEKTRNESENLFDTSDDKLVIDEDSCNEETILNAETGLLEPVRKLAQKNIPDSKSELRLSKDSDLELLENEECSAADDDDWEDIEIMTENDFDNDPKSSSIPSSSSTITDKPNNLYQTISRLYAASIKPKNKSTLKNRKPLLKNKLLVVEKKCSSKKSKLADNTDSPVPYPLPDFVTDAIPSPVSNELTVDPPVPLPSEPLNDLNDISAILEPSASTEIGSNNNNVTTPNLGSPIDLCNIDDDDIFILNDETNIEHALALAAEIEKTGNDLQNEIELDRSTFIVNKTNKAATVTTNTSTTTSIISDHNSNLNKNVSVTEEHSKTKKYRIDKLGFSITNGKIKYLCLVKSCSFLYSELDIGLQNHYNVEHPNLTWDGFCYSCESLVCFDDDNLPLFRELKHMNDVHINNIKKFNNFTTNTITTTTAIASSMLIPEKPKISLRRLSGDMLSIKPTCIDLNEDDLVPSSTEITTKSISSSSTKPISIQSLNFIKSTDLNVSYANNKTISSSVAQQPINNTTAVKTMQIPKNMFIKKLLNTPSVPPPIPPNLSRLNEETGMLESVNYSKINISENSENVRKSSLQPVQQNCAKNPIILNNQFATARTKDFQLKLKITNINDISASLSSSPIGNSSTCNTNSLLKKSYKIATSQSVVGQCTPQQQIKNNAFGGSNLFISSVAEGVRLPTTTPNSKISATDNESTSLLKIQSVCSLNSNKTSTQIPTAVATTTVSNDKISAPQPTKSPIITTMKPAVNINQTPLTATIIPTDSNSANVSNIKIMNRIQPWLQPYSVAAEMKSYAVVQLQLRAISLYALYKCMNATCFFTTNCSDKLIKHFICHEFSGATTNKSALLQSNINYRDWLNCSYCKYHGDTSENLLAHIKEIHLTDIYQCPYCFYRSCCECNVQEHQRNYHMGKKPLIYVTFGDRKKLALEIRFLARNRAKYIMPIPCNDCPKKFYLLKNYITHIREQHNAESDTYTCGICKIDLQKRGTSYHLSSSHNISIYQCIYCNVSSSIRSRMILHMTDQHPSNLLYSCVRVSPNKDMDIPEETIENSTVLANLSEPVDPSTLVECNFTIEQLNFMSPSLDAKSIQDNRSGTIILTLTNPPFDINKSTSKTPSPPQQQTQSKNLKILAVESLSNITLDNNSTSNSRSTIISPTPINTSVANTPKTTHELLKSPSTIKISSILQNCPKFLTNQSILKSALTTCSSTKSTDVITTNFINPTAEITDKSSQLIENTIQKNNESINSSSSAVASRAVVETCNDNNLNDRIIKAGKELVQDTGYEGYDLYRCAYPECVNIKITESTLFDHIQLKHSRNRSFKCPHCTSQYQSAKTLRHHLNTHRMHKYFCYFCNYTTITQQIIIKHISDSHSKNAFVKTVPLANPSNINNNSNLQKNDNQDNQFYVTCPSNTTPNEILQYGERLIRACDRKKSLTKKSFKPDEIDQLPMQSIFHHEVICSQCNYKTKVRTNMYRHLLYHTKEVVVPSIDPVNPVPCLNTNEKHYDRMINLACSSNINKDTTQNNSNELTTTTTKSDKSLSTTNNNSNNTKLELKIPIFIPSMKRYVCSVNNCNYLTINDSMLKHHLNTLHLTEKSYKCKHCQSECCVRKQLCVDKIIQHLKFHDSKIFVCNECTYIHYQKHLVERHIYEKHPNKTIDLIRYERTDSGTIINRQLYCGTPGGGGSTSSAPSSSNNNILLNTDKIINNNSNNVDDDMTWECTICKHKSINAMEMNKHVLCSHNIRFRYACLHCKFGAGQFKTVMEHITDKHPTKDRKVKCAFNRVDETPVVTEDFLQQDNRPLWSRADPHRVKHIRGILMEEEEEEDNDNNLNPMNSIDEIPIISNNNLQEKVLKKSKSSIIKTRQTRNDSEKNKQTINTENINKSSSATEINETTANSATSTNNSATSTETSTESDVVVVESNNTEDENYIDIYECSYCPIKNISFKSIYTHWLFHHCDKQKKNPLLSKPFAFKLWGFMSKENSTEIRLQEIKENDLIRLQRLGQRATRFQCNECWRLFANASSVTLHQENEHTNSVGSRCLQYKNITFYICNFCGYASSMECKTAAHLLNHYGGFKKCHLCNLKFDKFLDFVSHLAVHQVTFKDFIENDSEIIVFWNQIKMLYSNGLCIQRGFIPKKLNNTLLQQNVIGQIEHAVLAYGKSQKAIISNDQNSIAEQEKESVTTNKIIINEQIQNNLDNVIASTSAASSETSVTSTNTVKSIVTNEQITENQTKFNNLDNVIASTSASSETSVTSTNTVKSIVTNEQITQNQTKFNNLDNVIASTSASSETDSVTSKNTVKSIVINDHKISKTKIKKRTKKRTKDNEEWMPPTMKKRKIESETDVEETDDESYDDDESEDYLIPLKYLKDDVMPLKEQQSTSLSTSTDSNDSIIVVPKRKPGPKCMQQKPYSFYGLPPKKYDLKTIFTTMQLGNDEKPVVVSCENFARFVNIKPIVFVTKLDLNKFKEKKPVITYKRKLSHLINNIIDEQLRVKQFKESI